MSEVTLILRKPPAKSEFDYEVLHKLWPKSLIYCVDFGLRPINFAKVTPEKLEARIQDLNAQVEKTHKLSPFNGATEISPLLTLSRLHKLAVEENMGDIVAYTMRLFAGIKTIYLDLGVEVDVEKARKVILGFGKAFPVIKLGLIAPAIDFKKPGDVYDLLGNIGTFPCPFVAPDQDLEPQIEGFGEWTEVVISGLVADDAKRFGEIAKSAHCKFIFWSALAMKDLNIKTFANKPAPSPIEMPVPERNVVEMTAIFSSLVRGKRAMDVSGDDLLGHVTAGDNVKVIREFPPQGDRTVFGEIEWGEGTGFVVLKHQGQSKFQPKGDTHEQSKEHGRAVGLGQD